MAVKATDKHSYEILLVQADVKETGLRRLLSKSRNLLTVDLLWPRTSVARKTAARECRFVKSHAAFAGEDWARRILFREEIERHAAVAVSLSENLTDEKLEKFLRLAAKYALRTAADVVEKITAGIADVASAPLDALAAMAGSYPGPKTVCEGTADLTEATLPAPGRQTLVDVPLRRPGKSALAGVLTIEIRG